MFLVHSVHITPDGEPFDSRRPPLSSARPGKSDIGGAKQTGQFSVARMMLAVVAAGGRLTVIFPLFVLDSRQMP